MVGPSSLAPHDERERRNCYKYKMRCIGQLSQQVLPCHVSDHMEHIRRCRIPSEQLYRRLVIAAVEQYYRRRLPRWAGHVSPMPMDRLPRQLLAGFVANPRPAGSPLMT